MTLHDLEDRIASTAAHLDAAHHRLLTDLRAFDEQEGWHKAGAPTFAHWLSWKLGWELGTGREQARVARALGTLPRIDAAFANGEVSYCKVRAMTRVATPANEHLLLEEAKLVTGQQLERLCRKYATVQRHEALTNTRPSIHDRYVRRRELVDGMVRIEVVLPPDEAALVWAALDAAAASDPNETSERAFNRADALLALATGTATPAPFEILINAPAEALAPGAPVKLDTIAVATDGTCLPPATIQRLTCDGAVIGPDHRKTRTISTPLRRALLARDHHCQFPGCANTTFVDGHHIQHWAHGGDTTLDNLLLLCRRHHRFLHEHGYTITRTLTGPVFHDRHGRPVTTPTPRGPDGWNQVVALAQHRGHIPRQAPCWDGSDVDVRLLVEYIARADAGLLPLDWDKP
jgi:hypothetical protein